MMSGKVLRYDGTSGSFVGDFASIQVPTDLAFGPDGNLYVSIWGSDRIVRFDGATGLFIDAKRCEFTPTLGPL